MPGLDWLTARPYAHRGLHDAAAGIIENTASSIGAAVAAGYAIEIDLQPAADGEAMVFHDATLDRLTDGHGRLDTVNSADLRRVNFRNTLDRMLTLGEACDLVGGRSPLLLELKSGFGNDLRLADRVVEILTSYAGPVAAMSFDPYMVIALRTLAPGLPRGIAAERQYTHEHWQGLSPGHRRQLAFLLHMPKTRPHFT